MNVESIENVEKVAAASHFQPEKCEAAAGTTGNATFLFRIPRRQLRQIGKKSRILKHSADCSRKFSFCHFTILLVCEATSYASLLAFLP